MTDPSGIRDDRCILCGGRDRVPALPGQGLDVIVRCTSCALVQVHPRPDPVRVLAAYRDTAAQETYLDDLYLPKEIGFRQWFGRLIDETTRLTGTGRLLDVGSSVGLLMDEARKRGWSVTGLDPSGPAARVGRDRFGLTIHEGTLETCPRGETPHDLVAMVEVLEHVHDPRTELIRARERLRPDGWLILTTPNWNNVTRWIRGRAWDAVIPEGHLTYFTRSTLERLLGEVGFRIVRCRTRGVTGLNSIPRLRALFERPGWGESLVVWARVASPDQP